MVGGRTIPWYCRNRAMPMEGKRTIVYIEANVTMKSRMRESRTYGSVRG